MSLSQPSSPGFDSDIWKAAIDSMDLQNSPRSDMLIPLLDTVLKPGMTRTELLDLLGPPTFSSDGNDRYAVGIAFYGIKNDFLQLLYQSDKLRLARLSRG